MLRKGLAVREQALPPDHPEIADSLMNIGVALDENLHRPAEALPYFEKALAMLERKLPPQHPNLAFPLHGIGSCLVTLKKPRDALPYLERALTLRSGDDVAPTLRAATLTVLADALWDSGRDRRRAISLARDARALYVDAADAGSSGALDRWLAARGAR
jgi:serine/threonine-protein kinase